MKQINFIGTPNWNACVLVFFSFEKSKEAISSFTDNSLKVI